MVIAIIGMFFSFAAFFNFLTQCYYGDAIQNYSLRYDPRVGDGLRCVHVCDSLMCPPFPHT